MQDMNYPEGVKLVSLQLASAYLAFCHFWFTFIDQAKSDAEIKEIKSKKLTVNTSSVEKIKALFTFLICLYANTNL
jgi:hypothetical protein